MEEIITTPEEEPLTEFNRRDIDRRTKVLHYIYFLYGLAKTKDYLILHRDSFTLMCNNLKKRMVEEVNPLTDEVTETSAKQYIMDNIIILKFPNDGSLAKLVKQFKWQTDLLIINEQFYFYWLTDLSALPYKESNTVTDFFKLPYMQPYIGNIVAKPKR